MSNLNPLIPHPTLEWRYIDPVTGLIMPWLTLPCLEWLQNQPVANWRVFEYGSGYSTFWWSTIAKSNISVEYDKEWAQKTRSMQRSTQHTYVDSILPHAIANGKFDCIVIDGHYRDQCIEPALKSVRYGGYLIIDNYHQSSADWPEDAWKETDAILNNNFSKVVFHQQGHPDWKTLLVQVVN